MNYEDAIDKVRRLMRLAQSDNANEAASAAAMAQSIIDKYKLGAFSLEEGTEEAPASNEPIMDLKAAPLEESAKLANWKCWLASALAAANQCRIYLNGTSRGRGIAIVGRPSDAETVRYLYAWLSKEVDRLAELHGRGLGTTWRNNFRIGVVETIKEKLHEEHIRVKNEAVAQAASPSAIVLVNNAIVKMEKRKTEVDDWVKKNLKLNKGTGSRSTYDGSARNAGREAGKSIAIGGAKQGLGAGQRKLGVGQ